MPNAPLIEVKSLAKYYEDADGGTIKAVDNVSMTCRAGEIYGLLGPNGAGKTTTLRCLSTVLTPSAGTAIVGGYSILTQPEKVRANIGFVSGTTGLYARLTPREALKFFARLNGVPADVVDQRVQQTMDLFAVSSYADRPCDRLSTGMKQRVGLARAVVHDPPVIILDEPTSGLDPVAAQAVEQAIMQLRAGGKCVLLSTHMMYQAEEMCDRLGVIGDGRVLAEGTAAELMAQTGTTSLRQAFFALVGASTAVGGSASAEGADRAS